VTHRPTFRPAPVFTSRARRLAHAPLRALPPLLLAVAAAGAQDVGHVPERSPYRDLVFRQEATAFSGWYASAGDPAGVAPRSGPIVGLRYEITLGGPVQFMARTGLVRSERTVLDPTKPLATRAVETRQVNLVLADVGVTMNLTGQKSWHGLVPVAQAGVGIVSDFDDRDVGGFRLGTPFALTLGGGVRWVGGGRLQLRVDATDHLFQVRYPNTYFTAPSATVPSIRPASAPQSQWRHNAALTIGASYLFWR
jgi:hypothetical protein